MFDRILIPLDGSTTAEAILPEVRRLLRRSDSEVTLLRVAQPIPVTEMGAAYTTEFMLTEAEAYIRRMERRLEGEGIRVRSLAQLGSAPDTILEAAVAERSDVIAMCTHGRTGLGRLVFGSVTEQVLRKSPIPLLLVRAAQDESRVIGDVPPKKILLPLDGSATAREIIPLVRELSHLYGAHVVALRVIEKTKGREFVQKLDDLTKEDAEVIGKLDSLASWSIRTGSPAKEIIRVCEDHSIDMIAMTTHGRTGIPRWVVGSVTEQVIRHTPVPMFVMRASAIEAKASAPAGAADAK